MKSELQPIKIIGDAPLEGTYSSYVGMIDAAKTAGDRAAQLEHGAKVRCEGILGAFEDYWNTSVEQILEVANERTSPVKGGRDLRGIQRNDSKTEGKKVERVATVIENGREISRHFEFNIAYRSHGETLDNPQRTIKIRDFKGGRPSEHGLQLQVKLDQNVLWAYNPATGVHQTVVLRNGKYVFTGESNLFPEADGRSEKRDLLDALLKDWSRITSPSSKIIAVGHLG